MNDMQRVARLEDLPYFSSPPVQFTYTQRAALTLGQYPFTLVKQQMTDLPRLTDNALIYVRDISFYADIPEIDYQEALQLIGGTVNVPKLSIYMGGNAGVPVFRNPVVLGNYFRSQDYRLLVMPKFTPNVLLAGIEGTLQQHAGLAGKAFVNLTIEIYCQEIIDDNFISAVTRKYPQILNGGMRA